MRTTGKVVFFGILIAFCKVATRAGTVLTSNLPAGTAIINISGTQDGAASYNSDQSLWYHPFYTAGATQLVKYTVSPGTYNFRAINPVDAATFFPALSSAQLSQIFTAWTYNSPWTLDYLVFDSSAETNFSIPQLFDGSPLGGFYANANAAYSASLANGVYHTIRVGPLGRDSTIFTNSYTFTNTETLIFVVPDYYLPDNSGGVSVLISPAAAGIPRLEIALAGSSVIVSWPTNVAGGFILQQSSNLAPAIWHSASNVVSTFSSVNQVTVDSPSGAKFYRLFHP